MWVRGMTRAGHSGCQGGLSPVQTQRGNDSCAQIPLTNPVCWRRRRPPATAVREAKPGLFASFGEDWGRNGDELRQFPQILGGGGQQELVIRSARTAQAQSIEPEDALQMCEEHLDLLSLPT